MARKAVEDCKTQKTIAISSRMLDKLEEFCKFTMASRSSVVDAALEKYLTDERLDKVRKLDL